MCAEGGGDKKQLRMAEFFGGDGISFFSMSSKDKSIVELDVKRSPLETGRRRGLLVLWVNSQCKKGEANSLVPRVTPRPTAGARCHLE